MMSSSVIILFSSHIFWKLTSILGIVLWNVFIQYHVIIVSSYLGMRDWIGIIGGLVGLIGFENMEVKENKRKLDYKND